jgi:hypothetical protein
MGTEYLIIILMWCHMAADTKPQERACVSRDLLCVSQLNKFTTDEVVAKCLQPEMRK